MPVKQVLKTYFSLCVPARIAAGGTVRDVMIVSQEFLLERRLDRQLERRLLLGQHRLKARLGIEGKCFYEKNTAGEVKRRSGIFKGYIS